MNCKDGVANGQRGSSVLAGDCQLRIYRLAVVASVVILIGRGQINALTYMTTLVNDISAIYERDVTIRLNLCFNNEYYFSRIQQLTHIQRFSSTIRHRFFYA